MAGLMTEALDPGGNFLLALHQQVIQVTGNVAVLLVEEGRGKT